MANEDFLHAVQFPRGKNIPLPNCEGPKLRPFRPFGHVHNLELVNEVAVTNLSVVWKIKVDGVYYALKVFGFPLANDILAASLSRDELRMRVDHTDFFNCECRAYGRLEETGHENMVVRCYGYVLLTHGQEKTFRSRTSTCPDVLRRVPYLAGVPLRGIVKEWVPEGTEYFTAAMAPRMRRDLKTLNRIGIANRDIKENNYLGGKLVDFGSAWTVPHYQVDKWKKWIEEGGKRAEHAIEELEMERGIDQDSFDHMMEEWNEMGQGPRIWVRNFPNRRYSNLRSRQSKRSRGYPAFPGPDPFSYDWRGSKKTVTPALRKSPRRGKTRGGRRTRKVHVS
ncbi:Kinetochore Sim4 complex subunit FTA2 domain containing protein [Rhypophila sp. PSN 637]